MPNFHDDLENSKGTKDMKQRCEKAGFEVEVVTSADSQGG